MLVQVQILTCGKPCSCIVSTLIQYITECIFTCQLYTIIALQHDLNLLHEWSAHWQLKFNILKCKHVHFGPTHHYESYYLNGITIDIVESHKDLGIILDHQLKFHSHTTEVVLKANRLLGLIRRSFDSDMLIKLFTVLVCPVLE